VRNERPKIKVSLSRGWPALHVAGGGGEFLSEMALPTVILHISETIYVISMSNPWNLRGLCGWTFIHKVSTWISPRGYFPRGWNPRRIYLDISRMKYFDLSKK